MEVNVITLEMKTERNPGSVLIKIQKESILVNCPGGTERELNSYNLGLCDIDYIIFTEVSAATTEGLLGMLMTRAQTKPSTVMKLIIPKIQEDKNLFNNLNIFALDPIFNGVIYQVEPKATHIVQDEHFDIVVEYLDDHDCEFALNCHGIIHQNMNMHKIQEYNVSGKFIKQLITLKQIILDGQTLNYNDFIEIHECGNIYFNVNEQFIERIFENNQHEKQNTPDNVFITKEPNNIDEQLLENSTVIDIISQGEDLSIYPITDFVNFYNAQTHGNKFLTEFTQDEYSWMIEYTLFPPKMQQEQQLLNIKIDKQYSQINAHLDESVINRYFTKITQHSIMFLGTGASVPNKYNNVVGQLYRTEKFELLVDCGESTLQEIRFAYENLLNVSMDDLQNLTILITHEHADHYLGLGEFITQYYVLFSKLPNLVCQELVWQYLLFVVDEQLYEEYEEVQSNDFQLLEENRLLIVNEYFNADCNTDIKEEIKHSNFFHNFYLYDDNLKARIDVIKNIHTFNSVSYLITEHGRREQILFSGDLRPLQFQPNFDAIKELFNSQYKLFVVHECTFNQETQKEANLRFHSCFHEALDFIQQLSNVELLILTHISQRYCKETVINREICNEKKIDLKMLIEAYDFMVIYL